MITNDFEGQMFNESKEKFPYPYIARINVPYSYIYIL